MKNQLTPALATLDRHLLERRRAEIRAADNAAYARIKAEALTIAAQRHRRPIVADFDARSVSGADYQTARNRITGGR